MMWIQGIIILFIGIIIGGRIESHLVAEKEERFFGKSWEKTYGAMDEEAVKAKRRLRSFKVGFCEAYVAGHKELTILAVSKDDFDEFLLTHRDLRGYSQNDLSYCKGIDIEVVYRLQFLWILRSANIQSKTENKAHHLSPGDGLWCFLGKPLWQVFGKSLALFYK